MSIEEEIRKRCAKSTTWFKWHTAMSKPGVTAERQMELTKALALSLHDQLLLSSDRAKRRGAAYADVACKLLDLQTRIVALAGGCEE